LTEVFILHCFVTKPVYLLPREHREIFFLTQRDLVLDTPVAHFRGGDIMDNGRIGYLIRHPLNKLVPIFFNFLIQPAA
jgi:hypothetical protein